MLGWCGSSPPPCSRSDPGAREPSHRARPTLQHVATLCRAGSGHLGCSGGLSTAGTVDCGC